MVQGHRLEGVDQPGHDRRVRGGAQGAARLGRNAARRQHGSGIDAVQDLRIDEAGQQGLDDGRRRGPAPGLEGQGEEAGEVQPRPALGLGPENIEEAGGGELGKGWKLASRTWPPWGRFEKFCFW
ncbi:hypothetical protein [Phenylobacterium sp.]|uniref:hypothetical protein n=1 Tax=Phenylobacterium sp. TaxID=1871053 RepID=UPI0025D6EA91|nr:hypothetical protein [Phenylobacterium sp.]MCA3721441.1 hypothetical protein [Phenylobacterium sp.]